MTTIEHPVDEQTETVGTAAATEDRRRPGRSNGWQPTACILCECNCGIEVRLGGEDGRRFERIRGDKAHPASQGYTCEKALRLDHYQNGRHRLTSPLRRAARRHVRGDRLGHRHRRGGGAASPQVRDEHGGESIFYYGGGGQGNHLGGAYSGATLRGPRRPLPLERAGPGEDRRVLGQRQDARRHGARRLRARRGRALRRQEPVAVATASRTPARRSRRSPAIPSGR